MGTVISASSFEGYVPNKDPRLVKGVAVLDGKNFQHDVEGPRASFGNEIYFYHPFDTNSSKRVFELSVGNEIFYGTPTGIWRFDPISKLAHLLIEVSTIMPGWPWSVAYVGEKYYFAQYEIGLWEYDPGTGDIRHVVTPIYDLARFVCESYGRLCILSDKWLTWSAQDNGANLTPSLATGAGAQAVSMIGGIPYRVDPAADGIIVSTSRGMLKATRVDDTYVYRWRVLSREVQLFSPNGGCIVPDAGIVYITRHGLQLRKHDDDALTPPQAWEPDFSAFLRDTYLNAPNVDLPGNSLLYYSNVEQLLFVGFGSTTAEGLFQEAFVFSLVTGKWGRFNYPCRGLFEILDDDGEARCGFVDALGYFRRFTNNAHSDDYVSTESDLLPHTYNKPASSAPIRLIVDFDVDENGVPDTNEDGSIKESSTYLFSDELWYTEFDPAAYVDAVKTGLYTNTASYSADTDGVQELPLIAEETGNVGEELIGGVCLIDDDETDALLGGEALESDSDDFLLEGGTFTLIFTGQTDLYLFNVSYSTVSLQKYTPDKVQLNSFIQIGPLRVISQQRSIPMEECSFDFLTLGTSALGESTTFEDWNSDGIPEDWNLLAGAEDWGIIKNISYEFATELEMTIDAHQAVSFGPQLLFAIETSENAITYDAGGVTGRYGLLKLYTEKPYDFFYQKTLEIGGQTLGYDF